MWLLPIWAINGADLKPIYGSDFKQFASIVWTSFDVKAYQTNHHFSEHYADTTRLVMHMDQCYLNENWMQIMISWYAFSKEGINGGIVANVKWLGIAENNQQEQYIPRSKYFWRQNARRPPKLML